MRHLLAGIPRLVAGLAASAMTVKFVQHINVRIAQSVSLDAQGMNELAGTVRQARNRCFNSAEDLVVAVEEIVAESEPRTGIAPTEVVASFLVSLNVPMRNVYQGQLATTDERLARLSVNRANLQRPLVGSVEVELVCTPSQ